MLILYFIYFRIEILLSTSILFSVKGKHICLPHFKYYHFYEPQQQQNKPNEPNKHKKRIYMSLNGNIIRNEVSSILFVFKVPSITK